MTRRPRLVTIDVDELRRIVRGEVQVVRVRQATLERLAAATGRLAARTWWGRSWPCWTA